jgi:hypothetical protein
MLYERGTSPASQPNARLLNSRLEGFGDTGGLQHISSQLLRAELWRRDGELNKPACGSGGRRGSYNTSLHVGALFLILTLSTLGRTTRATNLHTVDSSSSLLVPYCREAFSQAPHSTSLPLPLTALRDWCFDRNSIRSPTANSFRLFDRPMSPLLLEQGLSCHGRSHRHDICVSGGHN